MSGKRTYPGAVVGAMLGVTAGFGSQVVGDIMAMPWWAVWFGVWPLAFAAAWLVMGILWRMGRLR